jgi:hypothetical protein
VGTREGLGESASSNRSSGAGAAWGQGRALPEGRAARRRRQGLSFPQGFDGFFRITAPGMMATRLYVGQPLVAPPNVKSAQLFTVTEIGTLVSYTKLKFDTTRGMAILFVENCAGHSASGVSFTCSSGDSESSVFYLVNQPPVLPPKATVTDPYGFGGFINLPVGAAVVQAHLVATTEVIAKVGFGVFADTISYVLMTPGPE